MKLLFVTPRFPYPPFRGDQSVPFHRMRILSRKHEITLVSFFERDEELAGIDALREVCQAIHTVKLPRWKSFTNMSLRGPISRLPFQVLYYQSYEFNQKLHNVLEEGEFDLVHAFMLRLAPFCRNIRIPVVLDLIDSMQLNFKRRVDNSSVPHKWLLQEELRRLINYESTICKQDSRFIVVSNKDKDCILSENVDVVPLGIDIERFSPSVTRVKSQKIIFSGNMFYGPNVQAVKWFVQNCFFHIQREIEDVEFIIAGNHPTSDIRELAKYPGITVTGFVESMPKVLHQASLAVAPMQSGSGMQFKILEAMSCGLPVVTNSLGLGDIKARSGIELLLAEAADDFVDKIVKVLKDRKLANDIGNKARAFVVNTHSWEHTTNMVESIYQQSMSDKADSTSV